MTRRLFAILPPTGDSALELHKTQVQRIEHEAQMRLARVQKRWRLANTAAPLVRIYVEEGYNELAIQLAMHFSETRLQVQEESIGMNHDFSEMASLVGSLGLEPVELESTIPNFYDLKAEVTYWVTARHELGEDAGLFHEPHPIPPRCRPHT